MIQRENDILKKEIDLVQRENDILKKEIDVWKIKENELKTKEQAWKIKEQELNSKVQGMLREIKILKRILHGKRVNRISSNPWRWNSRVKSLSRPPSAVSQHSRSLTNFSD
ncbi:hypothetical protein TNCV_1300931 [Trichonephila clavipes]|nr:hypothetical protein TNCV_1300931 [Trichonephila clavipes]